MNKLKNSLLAIVFVLPMLFVATSCDDDDDDGVTAWTEAQKSEFLEECEGDLLGGSTEVCECVLDGLSKAYSYSDYQSALEGEEAEDVLKILEIYTDCQE